MAAYSEIRTLNAGNPSETITSLPGEFYTMEAGSSGPFEVNIFVKASASSIWKSVADFGPNVPYLNLHRQGPMDLRFDRVSGDNDIEIAVIADVQYGVTR